MTGIDEKLEWTWRARVAGRTGEPSAIESSLRAATWLIWMLAASVIVFLTSNPLYLGTACLVGLVVCASLPQRSQQPYYGLVVKVALFFALLSLPFNLLTGSTGPTVLFELPRLTFPDWFGGVTLGGAVSLESLLFALDRALRLVALLLFATAFTLAVDHYRVLRLLPNSLRQLGIVLTVAVLLLPQLVQQSKAAVEAQRLRGRRVAGVRSLVSLAAPVLGASLERSVQRAESLDARGFGRTAVVSSARTAARGMASAVGAGLLGIGAFVYFYYPHATALALLLVAAGAALVGLALWSGGRGATSFYAKENWGRADLAVAGGALVAALVVVALRVLDVAGVGYTPYPEAATPAFHPAAVLAFLILLAPATLMSKGKGEGVD